MEIVKTPFIKNKKQDQDTGGHAYSKTGYIDKGVSFVLPQIAPRGFKIVSDHNFYFCQWCPKDSFGEWSIVNKIVHRW
jgi:hypothetical protein